MPRQLFAVSLTGLRRHIWSSKRNWNPLIISSGGTSRGEVLFLSMSGEFNFACRSEGFDSYTITSWSRLSVIKWATGSDASSHIVWVLVKRCRYVLQPVTVAMKKSPSFILSQFCDLSVIHLKDTDKSPFTLSHSVNGATSLVILLWLKLLKFLNTPGKLLQKWVATPVDQIKRSWSK